MIVALTGLPIGYSVIVALTGLPIGYSVMVALYRIQYNSIVNIQALHSSNGQSDAGSDRQEAPSDVLSLSQDGGKDESFGEDASDTMSQSSTHTQEEKVTSTTKDTPTKESGHRGKVTLVHSMVIIFLFLLIGHKKKKFKHR